MEIEKLEKIKGRIRFFDRARYYGFIRSEEHGDVFIHGSELDNPEDADLLELDTCVEFVLAKNPKGLTAKNVVICNE